MLTVAVVDTSLGQIGLFSLMEPWGSLDLIQRMTPCRRQEFCPNGAPLWPEWRVGASLCAVCLLASLFSSFFYQTAMTFHSVAATPPCSAVCLFSAWTSPCDNPGSWSAHYDKGVATQVRQGRLWFDNDLRPNIPKITKTHAQREGSQQRCDSNRGGAPCHLAEDPHFPTSGCRRICYIALQSPWPLTGVIRALRARNPPKNQKRSEKGWKSWKKVVFDSFLTFFDFFQHFFGLFSTFFDFFVGFRAPRARMTPVRGQGDCKYCKWTWLKKAIFEWLLWCMGMHADALCSAP